MLQLLRTIGQAAVLLVLLAPVVSAQTPSGVTGTPIAGQRRHLPGTLLPVRFEAPLPAQSSNIDDPTSNGTALGALIGAGAAVAVTAAMFAGCDAGCEGPSEGSTYLLAGSIGAGAGALIGWAVDKAHKGRPRAVVLSPVITTRQKSVTLAVRF